MYGAGPGRLSMADSPLPPWGPIHKEYIKGAGPVRGRAGPGRSGAGPLYVHFMYGVREWGGAVGPGPTGPGPGRAGPFRPGPAPCMYTLCMGCGSGGVQ